MNDSDRFRHSADGDAGADVIVMYRDDVELTDAERKGIEQALPGRCTMFLRDAARRMVYPPVTKAPGFRFPLPSIRHAADGGATISHAADERGIRTGAEDGRGNE